MSKKKNTIRIMPESLANKIAAGEVVDRPMSIVKELLENAVDAQASTITVLAKSGGKQLVEVIDNGMGMGNDDAILSIERHATSKIMSESDLAKGIVSMGFRGEALAAISAVSSFSMTTCDGESEGTFLLMEGGTLKTVQNVPAQRGTKISVKRLFYNVPARKKFLKSTATELSHIIRVITMEALARPDIQFRFFHDNRSLLKLFPSEKRDRAALLLGAQNVEKMREISACDTGIEMSGFISEPSYVSGVKKHQYIFVNNRPIKSAVMNRAVYDAFKNRMAKSSNPSWILYITVNPMDIDVNVHPNKQEIRFAFEGKVFDFIRTSIEKHLSSNDQTPIYHIPVREEEKPAHNGEEMPAQQEELPLSFVAKPSPEKLKRDISNRLTGDTFNITEYSHDNVKTGVGEPALEYISNDSTPSSEEKPVVQADSEEVNNTSWNSCEIIGQVFDSFIVVRKGEELLLVDQHAAHERILYEEIMEKWKQTEKCTQMLLTPVTISVSAHEKPLMEKFLDDFKSVGFDIEPFGPGGFIVRSAPTEIDSGDVCEVITGLLHELRDMQKINDMTKRRNEMHIRLACRSAIKAPHTMSNAEMKMLIEKLALSPYPYTCPHGRPTVLRLTENEIRKHFYRNKR